MIYEKIMAEIKEAMKTKEVDKKDVLKQVQSKVQNIAKDNKTEITDEVVFEAIRKEIKEMNKTLDEIKSKPESDLYKSTEFKIKTIEAFLPAQLTKEQLTEMINGVIANNSDVPKGKLTGIVMKELKGKADNKLIKETLDEILKA